MINLKCPENAEGLEELEKLIPLCRKEIFKQVKAKVETQGISEREASRQIAEELGRPNEALAIRQKALRERQSQSGTSVPGFITESEKKFLIAEVNKIKREKKQIIRNEKKIKKKEIPSDLPSISDRYELMNCDFREVVISPVDFIITDPPYGKEYLPLYKDLAIFSRAKLNEGGSLIVMTGQSYLPEVFNLMTPHLKYQWMLAYLTPGGQSAQLWNRKVNTFWKPVLWFSNGEYKGDWIGDVCKSNNPDKEYHSWGQSESGMANIIERFTYPGDTILDPFMGAATTGIVALKMNRKFIGIEINQETFNIAKERISCLMYDQNEQDGET